MLMCMSVLLVCMSVPFVHAWFMRGSEAGVRSPATEGTDVCEALCGCCD